MKPKLSDTQLIILSRACAREDRVFDREGFHLKGGALQKVVDALVGKRLLSIDNTKGTLSVLYATDAAFEAVGMELPSHAGQPGGEDAATAERALRADTDGTAPQDAANFLIPTRRTRENTKQAILIGMLEQGATVDEIAAACCWQKHTVRSAMAGALKKKLGLTITSEKVEGRGRVYRVQA